MDFAPYTAQPVQGDGGDDLDSFDRQQNDTAVKEGYRILSTYSVPVGNDETDGIPTWSDKLGQEVMRMVLEAYCESIFHDESYGFRPHRSCHTALTHIRNVWTGVTWFIEGDIKGCFDNINHDVLLEIIGKRIRDFRFLKLILTMLKAGCDADHSAKSMGINLHLGE